MIPHFKHLYTAVAAQLSEVKCYSESGSLRRSLVSILAKAQSSEGPVGGWRFCFIFKAGKQRPPECLAKWIGPQSC